MKTNSISLLLLLHPTSSFSHKISSVKERSNLRRENLITRLVFLSLIPYFSLDYPNIEAQEFKSSLSLYFPVLRDVSKIFPKRTPHTHKCLSTFSLSNKN